MKKIIFILLIFTSFSYIQAQHRWHFRMVIKATEYNSSYVFDFNDTFENQLRGGMVLTLNDGNTVQIYLIVQGGQLSSGAMSGQWHALYYEDHTYRNANYTNYATYPGAYNIDIYSRYDPLGLDPFDENDRIFEQIRFIDINGNGLINFEDLYTAGSDPGDYPNQLIYWTDKNGNRFADSGELFNDANGQTGRTQSVENIPIRDGLGDTDGDGNDEDDDEDDEDEEDEINLDDKLPGLDQFKNIIGVDGVGIPPGIDTSFSFSIFSYTFNFPGVASIPYVNNVRLMLRDCIAIFFTWLFISKLVTTFRQW
jgi:hypothetical protein